MNDDLAAFIATGIEFLVGGLMFLGAGLFVVGAVPWGLGDLPGEVEVLLTGESQLLASMVLLGSAYAWGVVAESMCRSLLEWDLNRVTVRQKEFTVPPDPVDPYGGKRSRPRVWLAGWVLGADYSEAQKNACVHEREKQRAYVMTLHFGLYADVESQLRRLRLERIAFVAMLMVALGFLLRSSWAEGVAALVLAAVLGRLVHTRFRRYCGSIARGYDTISTLGLKLVEPGVDASAHPRPRPAGRRRRGDIDDRGRSG